MSNLKIPFYGLKRFYSSNKKEILNEIDQAFSNGQFLKGPENKKLDNQLAQFCNRKYAITVSSGTDALFLALKSLGIKAEDEVIVTAYSFIASATAILRVGAKPVFVDIDPNNFLMDLQKTEEAISNKTKAIIAVQLFGQTMDCDHLENLSKKFNIPVIEDAAQSLGSTFGNRKSGGIGEISCISFDPTKIIGAFGTGGAILTNSNVLFDNINILANNGKKGRNYVEPGYNSQINTAQANLLSWQLSFIDKMIQKRQKIAHKYNLAIGNINYLQIPQNNPGSSHIFHKYVISTKDRDQLKEYLSKNGIETFIHYKDALFEHTVFNESNCIIHSSDNVLNTKNKLLSLPIYPDLSPEEIDYICDKIKSFYNKSLC